MGLSGLPMPERLRRMAFTTARTASSWPIILERSTSSISISLRLSPSAILPAGMPVIRDMTFATSEALTTLPPPLPSLLMRTIEPASSRASMALSGRQRSVT